MLYNTTWKDSKTKQIYGATKESEKLMDILEFHLLELGIVQLIGENPVPSKGRMYGEMIYYYRASPRRKLLSAAPRKEHDHINVVLFAKNLTRETLENNHFELGNAKDPRPDINIHNKDEIIKLIQLIKKNWHLA